MARVSKKSKTTKAKTKTTTKKTATKKKVAVKKAVAKKAAPVVDELRTEQLLERLTLHWATDGDTLILINLNNLFGCGRWRVSGENTMPKIFNTVIMVDLQKDTTLSLSIKNATLDGLKMILWSIYFAEFVSYFRPPSCFRGVTSHGKNR